jgi:hypothetical protein
MRFSLTVAFNHADENLDHAELAEIASETGYRLKVELGRNPSAIPSHLERLVRALDDAPATRSPAFVPPARQGASYRHRGRRQCRSGRFWISQSSPGYNPTTTVFLSAADRRKSSD